MNLEEERLPDLIRAEALGWEELERLVDPLDPELAEVPGYLPGWSVKDLLAHLAGWLAAAGQALEQTSWDSGVATGAEVDDRNRAFVEANRDQPLPVVLREVKAARRRLLQHLHGLGEIPPPAAAAVRKAGPHHYAEHLPRLREWVADLRAGQGPPA